MGSWKAVISSVSSSFPVLSFILWPYSQDSEIVSKVLWLDEIQHAVDEANMDKDKAKQCKSSPPFASSVNLAGYATDFLFLQLYSFSFWEDLDS